MTDLPKMTTARAIEIQVKRKRKTCRNGRPKKLTACVHCGQKFGARAIRAHVPRCPLRKRPLKGERLWNF